MSGVVVYVRVQSVLSADPDMQKLFTSLFRRVDEEILSYNFLETAGSTYAAGRAFYS
jgi:hypothetical protein